MTTSLSFARNLAAVVIFASAAHVVQSSASGTDPTRIVSIDAAQAKDKAANTATRSQPDGGASFQTASKSFPETIALAAAADRCEMLSPDPAYVQEMLVRFDDARGIVGTVFLDERETENKKYKE